MCSWQSHKGERMNKGKSKRVTGHNQRGEERSREANDKKTQQRSFETKMA